MSEYIVAYITENGDLYYERFDDVELAEAFISDRDDKCLLIRIEGGCDWSKATVTVEDHT